LERLWASVFSVNWDSVKNAGRVFEARLRRAAWMDGVVIDKLIYSVVREYWEKQREEKEDVWERDDLELLEGKSSS
jgi:hypothetical protein